jgi:hypothetical protein
MLYNCFLTERHSKLLFIDIGSLKEVTELHGAQIAIRNGTNSKEKTADVVQLRQVSVAL